MTNQPELEQDVDPFYDEFEGHEDELWQEHSLRIRRGLPCKCRFCERFNDFIFDVWKPTMDSTRLTTDSGKSDRIPNDVKALSFTILLKEYLDGKTRDF